jgi:hypothetical protein
MIGGLRGDARKRATPAPSTRVVENVDVAARARLLDLAREVKRSTHKATLLAWASITLAMFALGITLAAEVVL